MSHLISSLAWVRRGVAATQPSKYILDDEELERVAALAQIELEDARVELQRAHQAAKSLHPSIERDGASDDDDESDQTDAMQIDAQASPKTNADELAEYKLDEYDQEEDEPARLGSFSNIKGLTFYRNNEEDPYITLKEDDEEEERAALEVKPTDNLIVTAKTVDELSQLEIYVYDEAEENLYVHHDLMLPNFPLCLEWLDFPPSSSSSSSSPSPSSRQFGNYIAVGTLDPEIEIWSLDVLDSIYPDAVLGQRPDKHTAAHVPNPSSRTSSKKKKTKTRKPKRKSKSAAHHVDAVLALSWNRTQRHLLASASADCTVKLWDLSRCSIPDNSVTNDDEEEEDVDGITANGTGGSRAVRNFDSIHTDKIQAVQWNPQEPSALLTGSYDRTVRMIDSRTLDKGVGALLGSDVEALRWDPWDPHSFYVSVENGHVMAYDTRALPTDPHQTPCKVTFTLAAHDGPASALDVNPHIRGCLLTGGGDKLVKVWNVQQSQNGGKKNVSLVTSRDLGVGKVFSASFSPDDPLTLGAAGSSARLQIWDVGASAQVRKVFGPKLRETGKALNERQSGNGGVIGVISDGEESDEE